MRRRLENILSTDAEFEAFCIDCFPIIQKSFGSGMSRIQKTNILLESIDADEISANLDGLANRALPTNVQLIHNKDSLRHKMKRAVIAFIVIDYILMHMRSYGKKLLPRLFEDDAIVKQQGSLVMMPALPTAVLSALVIGAIVLIMFQLYLNRAPAPKYLIAGDDDNMALVSVANQNFGYTAIPSCQNCKTENMSTPYIPLIARPCRHFDIVLEHVTAQSLSKEQRADLTRKVRFATDKAIKNSGVRVHAGEIIRLWNNKDSWRLFDPQFSHSKSDRFAMALEGYMEDLGSVSNSIKTVTVKVECGP